MQGQRRTKDAPFKDAQARQLGDLRLTFLAWLADERNVAAEGHHDEWPQIHERADSLRDVTAFPKVQNASEIMSECPSVVDAENLDVLGIAVTATEDE